VQYLLDIAGGAPGLALRPLYRVDGRGELEERVLADWPGHEGHGPVRVGNQAAEHVQHDVFGELVLALAPVFLDQRFQAEQTAEVLELLVRLARKGVAAAGTPDAGIWEYRTISVPQTFSSLMGWAAAERMRGVAARHAEALVPEFAAAAERIRAEIVSRAWDGERRAFVGSYGGRELDASLLQMASLRFLAKDDPRLVGTIEAIARELGREGWLQRYRLDDGFGRPRSRSCCARCGTWRRWRRSGGAARRRRCCERVLGALSPLGLLAEDFDPRGGGSGGTSRRPTRTWA
jgi:GH15 family glucan-1,4-alpha-glucosidase